MSFSCYYIIWGDFNAPDINWASLTGSTLFSNLLCDLVFSKNLIQLVSDPTHCKGNCLDLLLSSSQGRIHSVCTDQSSYMSASDHFLVSASIITHDHPLRERIVPSGFNFSRANFTDLDSYFLEIDFSPIYASTDVEFIWSHLKGVIWDACNLLVPLCERKKLRGPHWYTSEVRHLLNRVHTTRRRIKQISACRLTKLDRLEKDLSEAIVLAKAKYETHLARAPTAYTHSTHMRTFLFCIITLYYYLRIAIVRSTVSLAQSRSSNRSACRAQP